MRNISLYRVSIIGVAILGVMAITFYGMEAFRTNTTPLSAQAATDDNLISGWAWSSQIGWISLSCKDRSMCDQSNYQVVVNKTTNRLSGYGWSSSVGWIQFDPSGPYPTNPQHSATLDPNARAITGWIRAVSTQGDGWDGWIKLAGSDQVGGSYGVTVRSDGKLSGFAWGDLTVGWLKFDWAYFQPPACSFTADPATITPPQASTLRYACRYADQCSIDQGIGPVCDSEGSCATGGLIQVRPAERTTYTIGCTNFMASSVQQVIVDIAGGTGRIREDIP